MANNLQIFNNLRLLEDYNYNGKLDFLTKFNIINNLSQKKIIKISLNFGFKNIGFNKKQMVPFFMVLELISNQKCVVTRSRKNIINLKIKKGGIVGCKVTLRNKNLFNFLDTLILALPRAENFKLFNLKNKNKSNNFSTVLSDLFIFHSLESVLVDYIKKLDINFIFNTVNNSEKKFLLTYFKIPVI